MLAGVLPAVAAFRPRHRHAEPGAAGATAADAARLSRPHPRGAARGPGLRPLMTLYLTETTDPDDIGRGRAGGAGHRGQALPRRRHHQFRAAASRDIAQGHAGAGAHGSDRPAALRPRRGHRPRGRHLRPRGRLHRHACSRRSAPRCPSSDVVLEHVTTADGVDYVRDGARNLAGDDHRPPPDAQPQRDLRRRHPPALLLPADRQARAPPPGAARRRHRRRPALLPRHRQRPAPARRQGGRVRLRRRLLRPRRPALARRGLRGGRRTRPPRRLRQPPRPRLLRPAAERGRRSPSPAATPRSRSRPASRPAPARSASSSPAGPSTGASPTEEDPPCSAPASPPTRRWRA